MRILLSALLTLLLSSIAFAEDAPSTAFTLTTDAFLDTGPIPVLYTCDGKNESFSVTWSNVPAKTKSFALIMKDPKTDTGVFYHWVMYNIPAKMTTLPASTVKAPTGAKMGKNSFNKENYGGPCPPKDAEHTYIVTLYALDGPLNVSDHATGSDVEKALGKNVLGKAQMTTVYSRWMK